MKTTHKAPPSRLSDDPTDVQSIISQPVLLTWVIVIISLAIIVGGGYTWLKLFKTTTKTQATGDLMSTNKTVSLSFENVPDDLQTHLVDIIKPKLGEYSTQVVSQNGDIRISNQKTDGAISWQVVGSTETNPVSSGTLLKTNQTTYYLSLNQSSVSYASAIQTAITDAYPDQNWTYLALGDIIPARDVFTYSKRLGFTYPVLKVAERTKQADLTIANLETTIADGQANGEGAGMMVFTAPAKSLEALSLSGIDGVNLANNHAMNGGAAKVSEMLQNLNNQKIGSFGVGKAGTPASWTTTVKGLRITHLGYDSVPGNIEPTVTSPGAHRISLSPWGTLSAADITTVQSDIKTAKQSADIVIPWFHWGTEYTHVANNEQRRMAQACVDAGADVVIGTHPHWTQGVELYKDHVIAYSLGNFVFDQNWSEETKRSAELELQFNGKKVIGAKLLPAKIDNWVQPRFLQSSEPLYSQILDDIAKNSWWK